MVDFQRRDTKRGIDELGDDRVDGGHDDRDHDHHGDHDHDHHAADVESLGAAVVTVSSTRTIDEDVSGDRIVSAFEEAGHTVADRELITDEYDTVQRVIEREVGREDVDAVVTTGGTGVTPDDVTIEAVSSLFDKELPGFGELFRRLSYDEIGARTVATRATAGVIDGVPVFCLPGSEGAVRLGVEEIVLPTVGHLAGLAHPSDAEE